MLRLKLTVNLKQLAQLRDLPVLAQRNIKRLLQTDLKPELQQETDRLFSTPPGPRVGDFEFGSPESKAYYFWLIRNNPDLVDEDHWKRTGEIGNAFEVRISDNFRENLITISNLRKKSTGTEPYPARYVYGPWAVAGHIDTGWFEQARVAKRLLRQKARARIRQYWRQAIRDAAKGKG